MRRSTVCSSDDVLQVTVIAPIYVRQATPRVSIGPVAGIGVRAFVQVEAVLRARSLAPRGGGGGVGAGGAVFSNGLMRAPVRRFGILRTDMFGELRGLLGGPDGVRGGGVGSLPKAVRRGVNFARSRGDSRLVAKFGIILILKAGRASEIAGVDARSIVSSNSIGAQRSLSARLWAGAPGGYPSGRWGSTPRRADGESRHRCVTVIRWACGCRAAVPPASPEAAWIGPGNLT